MQRQMLHMSSYGVREKTREVSSDAPVATRGKVVIISAGDFNLSKEEMFDAVGDVNSTVIADHLVVHHVHPDPIIRYIK